MRKIIILSALLMSPTIFPENPVAAEEAPSSTTHQADLMEKFAGSWKAEGTSFGMPSKSEMLWATDLAHKFYRIEFRINMQSDNKTQTFIGHGYYRKGGNDGFWADTGGALHPMVTNYSSNDLTTIWGKAGGEQGRSSYKLQDDGSIEVVDSILRESGWHEFNRTSFRRAN